jgi:TrmH family RNA methyltransferase
MESACGNSVRLPRRWRVVLVSPQNQENVGAAARVMANLGAGPLVLVAPRCTIQPGGKAGAIARAGMPLLEQRIVVNTLKEALGEVAFSIALTMQTSEDRPVEFVGLCPAPLLGLPAARSHEAALVFGREDHGLTNEECSHCSARWTIPTRPDAPSLNLAQAVAIALAGVRQAEAMLTPPPENDDSPPLPQREIEGLLGHVEEMLHAVAFERGVPLDQTMRQLRRLALRAGIDHAEMQTLRGICRRVLNATRGPIAKSSPRANKRQ